jgi:hypothetical protein
MDLKGFDFSLFPFKSQMAICGGSSFFYNETPSP